MERRSKGGKKGGEKRKRDTGGGEGNEEIGACKNGRLFARLKGVGYSRRAGEKKNKQKKRRGLRNWWKERKRD